MANAEKLKSIPGADFFSPEFTNSYDIPGLRLLEHPTGAQVFSPRRRERGVRKLAENQICSRQIIVIKEEYK